MRTTPYFVATFGLALLFQTACGPNDDDQSLAPDAGEDVIDDDGSDTTPETCGNGALDPGEACDGDQLGDAACPYGGTLACTATCELDESGCEGPPESCGDGVINVDEGEVCDADAPFDATCASIGAGTGSLSCDDACQFDTSACVILSACGDGIVAEPEECDDGNRSDGDGCTYECLLEVCGDGIRQPGEACEAPTLGVCEDGQLGIHPCEDCALGELTCPDDGTCGDGVIDFGERCDDGNTESMDDCAGDCSFSETCLNGVLDEHEACEGTDLNGLTCADFGFNAGELGCFDCTFTIAGCHNTRCGDRLIEGDETCDDGNRTSGDGCSRDCQLEDCFDYLMGNESQASAHLVNGGIGFFGGLALPGQGTSDWFRVEVPAGVDIAIHAQDNVNAAIDDGTGAADVALPHVLSNGTADPMVFDVRFDAAADACTEYWALFTYDAICDPDDDYEENDIFADATMVPTGGVSAWIGDPDFYYLDIHPSCNGYLSFTDEVGGGAFLNGKPLVGSDGSGFYAHHTNIGEDIDRIVVAVYPKEPMCLTYEVYANENCECPVAYHGGMDIPIVIPQEGGVLLDQATASGNNRYYVINPCDGAQLRVQAASDVASEPPVLALTDADGVTVASSMDGTLAYVATSADPLTLVVSPSVAGDGTCTVFDLFVDITDCSCDDTLYEPNDTMDGAAEITDYIWPMRGLIRSGDEDWFFFPSECPDAEVVQLHAMLYVFFGMADIAVFNADGDPLGTARSNPEHGGYVDLLSPPGAGFYTRVTADHGTCLPFETGFSVTCPMPEADDSACGDFWDNDLDGLTDCEDPDCEGTSPCAGP